jgi:hypothetical protein
VFPLGQRWRKKTECLSLGIPTGFERNCHGSAVGVAARGASRTPAERPQQRATLRRLLQAPLPGLAKPAGAQQLAGWPRADRTPRPVDRAACPSSRPEDQTRASWGQQCDGDDESHSAHLWARWLAECVHMQFSRFLGVWRHVEGAWCVGKRSVRGHSGGGVSKNGRRLSRLSSSTKTIQPQTRDRTTEHALEHSRSNDGTRSLGLSALSFRDQTKEASARYA